VLTASALMIVLLGGSATAGGLYLAHRRVPTTTPNQITSHSTTTVQPPTGPSGPGYQAARKEWVASATFSLSDYNVPLLQAVADLQNGLSTDRNTSGYADAISEVQSLTQLPDATAIADGTAVDSGQDFPTVAYDDTSSMSFSTPPFFTRTSRTMTSRAGTFKETSSRRRIFRGPISRTPTWPGPT